MNRFKVVATIFFLGLMALALSPGVKADDWNKETIVTFSEPVEVPGGIILPAGTYVFKLMDSPSNRHIVQVFNKEKTHLYATILTIPNFRLRATEKTVMTFGERAVGSPEAIRAWFYPGRNWGEEFVYPKTRAAELAKVTDLPVLAMPSEFESFITAQTKTMNDEPIIALREAPLKAVKPTGEEVDIDQVVESPPAQIRNEEIPDRLPQTASSLPLLALIGLLSLGAGFALWVFPKRTA